MLSAGRSSMSVPAVTLNVVVHNLTTPSVALLKCLSAVDASRCQTSTCRGVYGSIPARCRTRVASIPRSGQHLSGWLDMRTALPLISSPSALSCGS